MLAAMCVTISMSHSSLKRSEENVVTPDHGTERVCMEEASAMEVREQLCACSYVCHYKYVTLFSEAF